MTAHACVNRAARDLVAAGFTPEDARRDAVVLARHVLGWSLADWVARARDNTPGELATGLAPLIARRATREPVAYITGTREFHGRDFRVTRDVLIPRPETEFLIDTALEPGLALPRFPSSPAPQLSSLVLDVGTGSGCLAITLALAWPSARVVASDTSAAAIDVARANARALGADRVEFVEAAFVPPGLPPADLIVSNPPYVPERDRASLTPDVRDCEPASALFGGEDGLDVIRALVPAAARALAPGGVLVMEIGAGQADAVATIVTNAGLTLRDIRHDLQGIPRIVTCHR